MWGLEDGHLWEAVIQIATHNEKLSTPLVIFLSSQDAQH